MAEEVPEDEEDSPHWPEAEDFEDARRDGEAKEDEEIEEREEKIEPERDMTKLMVLHRRLGHPANETLVRTLKLAAAPQETLDEAKKLKCPACDQITVPLCSTMSST